MANMSYCRFRNTSYDLCDCLEAIAEGDDLSDLEADAGKRMFHNFLAFCVDNDIIDCFDDDALDNLFKSLRGDEQNWTSRSY